jgi:hypothetical protein
MKLKKINKKNLITNIFKNKRKTRALISFLIWIYFIYNTFGKIYNKNWQAFLGDVIIRLLWLCVYLFSVILNITENKIIKGIFLQQFSMELIVGLIVNKRFIFFENLINTICMFYVLYTSNPETKDYFYQSGYFFIRLLGIIFYLNLPSPFKITSLEVRNNLIQNLGMGWLPKIIMKDKHIKPEDRRTFQKTFFHAFGISGILYPLTNYLIFNQIAPYLQKKLNL